MITKNDHIVSSILLSLAPSGIVVHTCDRVKKSRCPVPMKQDEALLCHCPKCPGGAAERLRDRPSIAQRCSEVPKMPQFQSDRLLLSV